VGASSRCEILDFKLKGDTDLSALPEKLNNALPEGITVVEAYEAERKPSEIKWLEINGTFEYDGNNAEAMLPKLSEFFSTDEIVIEKRTKRGMGEADIKPMIREIFFTAPNGSEVLLNAVISAQEPTLNPEHLVSALLQKAPEIAPDFAKFERINIFDADMTAFR
jgi:radical SAM-linked protein